LDFYLDRIIGKETACKLLMKSIPGVHFTKILHKAFTCADPKSAKNTVKPPVFFVLLGSGQEKAANKMLVILTPDQKRDIILL